MKKIATLVIFFALATSANAQEGAILYTEYNPDWCLESIQNAPPDSIKLDFDGDGMWDFAIRMFYKRYIDIRFIPANGWEFRSRITSDTLLPPAFQHLGLAEADTIVPNAPIGWAQHSGGSNRATFMCGVRKIVNDSTIYYGWFNQIWIDSTILGINNGGTPRIKEYQCVRDMAFCTIPNYPLRWGQTSLTSVEGNGGEGFATLHPNPTTGLVTVKGENGRKCMRKVVRE